MTKEQLKQALNVCSEHEACENCPAHQYCDDLSVLTGEALNAIEMLEAENDTLTGELDMRQGAQAEGEAAVRQLDEWLAETGKKEYQAAMEEEAREIMEKEKNKSRIRLILEAKPPLVEPIEMLADTFAFDTSEQLTEIVREFAEENGVGEYLAITVEVQGK